MKKRKQHQVKAGWYYIFWSIMALSVVTGQIYVGNGYREMSESNLKLREALFQMERGRLLEFQRTR